MMEIVLCGETIDGEEVDFRIAYLGNGDWELQVGDGEILVLDDLEEAMRILKEQNPE